MSSVRILRRSFFFSVAILLASFTFAGCGDSGGKAKRSVDIDEDEPVGRLRENEKDYARAEGGEELIKGKAAFEIGKYDEAAMDFSIAVQQGNAEAMYRLGKCFVDGTGVERDVKKAVPLFRDAAKAGYRIDVQTSFEVGQFLFSGNEVRKDELEAVKWYRYAADQGHADAQFELGKCYFHGIGVKQDYAEAAKWFQKADDRGHDEAGEFRQAAELFLNAQKGRPAAQYDLGRAYEFGFPGITKTLSEAVKWYRKAADQGHDEAKNRLKIVEMILNAQNGQAKAQYELGMAYENGSDDFRKSPAEAVTWFRKAANQGYAEAQYELGNAYEAGSGVLQSHFTAMSWYREAANQGHAGAEEIVKREEARDAEEKMAPPLSLKVDVVSSEMKKSSFSAEEEERKRKAEEYRQQRKEMEEERKRKAAEEAERKKQEREAERQRQKEENERRAEERRREREDRRNNNNYNNNSRSRNSRNRGW